MLNECIPTKFPAQSVTIQATGAITGKRFCKISAARIGGGLTGGTSQVTTSFPGSGANLLSTDVVDAYQAITCSVAGEAALGVAAWDLPAASGDLSIGKAYKFGTGIILPITCGANITAGQQVMTDAQGRAIPWVSPTATNGAALPVAIPLGYAVDSAASGADCEIALY